MRALREMEDQTGETRVAGEEWLISKPGNYMPGPYEEIVETLQGSVLTASKGIHLRAKANFTDFLGKVNMFLTMESVYEDICLTGQFCQKSV